ncbi:MAG TPA: fibronectin type III domain-containing protein [Opitutaceae bacterium]|nr:fibronectin type III domain-containing protein [Opitutaceae bacterium]
MNAIPIIPTFWPSNALACQTEPVDASLCAHPPGAGLFARTLGCVRGGLALFIFGGGLAAGSAALRGESSPDATIHLSTTLVSPVDVLLEWKDASPGAAGHTVEYATDPNGPFIVLNYCPPGQTTYKHPNLMPQTTFYYRVRGIYGPVTDPVEVTLPGQLSDEAYKTAFYQPEDFAWTVPKTLPDKAPLVKKSIRNATTLAEAAPSDLKATFVRSTVSGFELTWTNHSSDEDGFLLESKEAGRPDFTVAALIKPKINAFGWALKPPLRHASYRIRAFYYGTPSNLESKTTVLPGDWKNPTAKVETPSSPGQ